VSVGFLCPTIFHVGYDVLYDGKVSCRARIVVMKKAVEHYTFMSLDTAVNKLLNEIFTIFCPFSLMTVPMLSVIRKFLYNAFYRLLLLSVRKTLLSNGKHVFRITNLGAYWQSFRHVAC